MPGLVMIIIMFIYDYFIKLKISNQTSVIM